MADILPQHYEDLIDDGEMLMYGFRLIVVVGEDGVSLPMWKVDGVVAAAALIGQLECAKFELYHRHMIENNLHDVGRDE